MRVYFNFWLFIYMAQFLIRKPDGLERLVNEIQSLLSLNQLESCFGCKWPNSVSYYPKRMAVLFHKNRWSLPKLPD